MVHLRLALSAALVLALAVHAGEEKGAEVVDLTELNFDELVDGGSLAWMIVSSTASFRFKARASPAGARGLPLYCCAACRAPSPASSAGHLRALVPGVPRDGACLAAACQGACTRRQGRPGACNQPGAPSTPAPLSPSPPAAPQARVPPTLTGLVVVFGASIAD